MNSTPSFQLLVRDHQLCVRLPGGRVVRYQKWRDTRRRHRRCCRGCPYWSWVLPEERR